MELISILTLAYAVMGVVALVGYVPQIIEFYKNPRLCVETPVSTWGLWTAQTIVFHAYAVLVNGDVMYMATTGVFMVATVLCFALQLHGRYRAHKLGLEGRRGVVVPFTPPTDGSPTKPVRPPRGSDFKEAA